MKLSPKDIDCKLEIKRSADPCDLYNLDRCEVCGEPVYMRTRDMVVTFRIDGDGRTGGIPSYTDRRFCVDHQRAGKAEFRREHPDAYFARLRATEGTEI